MEKGHGNGMRKTMERAIHPGWLTLLFESEDGERFACYHQCVACGETIEGRNGDLLGHTREKHPAEAFHLELYVFRSALHALHPYFGLTALEWPDKATA